MLLKAAEQLVPAISKKKKSSPCIPAFPIAMHNQLKIGEQSTDTLNIAVYACTTTCFYSAAYLREFTVPTLNAFNSEIYVKPSDISSSVDRAGRPMTVFFLPRTKTVVYSETVAWSKQNNASDPQKALERHLKLNEPLAMGHCLLIKIKTTKESMWHSPKRNFLKSCQKQQKLPILNPCKGTG